MIEVNAERLLGDLRRLAEFGKFQTGVDRTAFTDADIEARRWLCGRLDEAGIEARMDRFGTVLGRSPRAGAALLIGSHTDTVPKGGWLDGALGAVYGLEVARALAEAGQAGAVDVVSFQDEEGTFVPCLGAKAFCGVLDETEVSRAASGDGRRLAEILPVLGLPEETIGLEPGRHRAFLETHIEQGPRLESAGIGIGIVTGIVGIRRFCITATGRADHAGTTPMAMRRDAGSALIRLAAGLIAAMPDWGSADTLWNVGKIQFRPGAANVVPAEASLIFEFRDLEPAVLAAIEKALRQAVAEAAELMPTIIEPIGMVDPVAMDAYLQSVVREAAEALGEPTLTMSSGAGHDAMVLARSIPTMLMFVPSIGGRSHDIAENTADEDIVRGCRVMANAADALFNSGWVGAA